MRWPVERFPTRLQDFQRLFPDDASCIQYIFERRWPNGFRCPWCDHDRSWWMEKRQHWECARCHKQTSVTAGTLMHRTRLPLHTWFWAAYLMATHSNGLSALQLKHQLGVSYSTAWLLCSKLRRAMVDPDRERLRGVVEVDQAEIPYRDSDPPVGVPAGKLIVVGAVEVLSKETGRPAAVRGDGRILENTRAGRIRLAFIPTNEAEHIEAFISANIERGTLLLTDGHASYSQVRSQGYRHRPYTVGRSAAHIYLPWIHRVFALVKRWGLGVYHGLRRRHIQTYLDEFVFRFNRRATRRMTFERILQLASLAGPQDYHAITGQPRRDREAERLRREARLASNAGTNPPPSAPPPESPQA